MEILLYRERRRAVSPRASPRANKITHVTKPIVFCTCTQPQSTSISADQQVPTRRRNPPSAGSPLRLVRACIVSLYKSCARPPAPPPVRLRLCPSVAIERQAAAGGEGGRASSWRVPRIATAERVAACTPGAPPSNKHPQTRQTDAQPAAFPQYIIWERPPPSGRCPQPPPSIPLSSPCPLRHPRSRERAESQHARRRRRLLSCVRRPECGLHTNRAAPLPPASMLAASLLGASLLGASLLGASLLVRRSARPQAKRGGGVPQRAASIQRGRLHTERPPPYREGRLHTERPPPYREGRLHTERPPP